MPDKISVEQRSRIMSSIRSRNTKPEIIVRKYLHSLGYRFRLHDKKLPGKPDIVIKNHKTAIIYGVRGTHYLTLHHTTLH